MLAGAVGLSVVLSGGMASAASAATNRGPIFHRYTNCDEISNEIAQANATLTRLNTEYQNDITEGNNDYSFWLVLDEQFLEYRYFAVSEVLNGLQADLYNCENTLPPTTIGGGGSGPS